jgi:tetratricopeptide (TPR) repeat protein
LLQGDKADWRARRDAALALFDELADPGGLARAEWFLAFAETDLGDLTGTEELVNQALATCHALDDRWGMAALLTTRAKLAHVRGDTEALRRDSERAAELFGVLGDRWGVLQASEWLAGLADMTTDYELSARLHREGLRLAEDLGLWPEVAGRLSWLGWVSVQRGEYAQTREFCERAMRMSREQGNLPGMVFAELGLAFATRREGKLDIAETHLNNLVAAAKGQDPGSGHALYLTMVLTELGFIAESRGDAPAALAHHREAFDVAKDFGETRALAWAAIGLAGAQALAGHPRQAAQLLGAAARTHEATGLPSSPEEHEELNRITSSVRAALGEDAFAAEFDLGGEAGVVTLRESL